MKYFLDTEFIEGGRDYPVTLISIGIVAEDGRKFYGISSEFNEEDANDWVKQNVLPHVKGPRYPISQIKASILEFCDLTKYCKPEFWGYYADYDWVVFCQIFGTMMDLPKGWPMYCRDLKQFADSLGNPTLPKHSGTEHHALADAEWNMAAYDFLVNNREHKTAGVGLIWDERIRQLLFEGWTAEHDDQHDFQELLKAAVCYIDYAMLVNLQGHSEEIYTKDDPAPWKKIWPWDTAWFKPSDDPIRNLVKAGALIAAEIDRLKRKAAK